MREFITVQDHQRALEKTRKYERTERLRLKEANERALRSAEASGYARGVEHGWRDAMQRFRQLVGAERSELIREWREAAIARAIKKKKA